jgi:hypothetical protein
MITILMECFVGLLDAQLRLGIIIASEAKQFYRNARDEGEG